MKVCEKCQATYPGDFTICPKDQSPLRVTSELAEGMVIRDKYKIIRKIGSGGMATVYAAQHLAFNELRAIKVVNAALMNDDAFLRRFRTEAVITRKLQHPNAVRVDDLDTTDDGFPYIVMEYVEGENLRTVIRDEGLLPVERALNIARQVCAALGAAHKLGITHRDIKPDNILLVPQPGGESAKVLDFGIARIREGSGVTPAHTATQTGVIVGTPQYLSPEQAMGKHGEEIDGRSDLYSLGVVLYEMITGQLPFQSDTAIGLLLHHIHTAPTPPQYLKPELQVPPYVSLLLMKALEKDRGRRFQSADEMLAAMNAPQDWAKTAVLGSNAVASATTATVVAKPAAPPAAPPTGAAARPAAPTAATVPVPAPAAAAIAPAAARPIPVARASGPPVSPRPTVSAAPSRFSRGTIAAIVLVALALLGFAGLAARARKQARAAAALALQEPPAVADNRILEQVRAALANSASLKSDDINVAVADRAVTLSGSVADGSEKELAGTLARAVPGVTGLNNQLQIRSSETSAPSSTPTSAAETVKPKAPSTSTSQSSAATDTSADSSDSLDSTEEPAASSDEAGNVRQLNDQGFEALRNRRPGIAMQYFQQVLDTHPNNKRAQKGLRMARTMRQRMQGNR